MPAARNPCSHQKLTCAGEENRVRAFHAQDVTERTLAGIRSPLAQVRLHVTPGSQLPQMAFAFENVVVCQLPLRHGASDFLGPEIEISPAFHIRPRQHRRKADCNFTAPHLGKRHRVCAAGSAPSSPAPTGELGDRLRQIAIQVHRIQG